MKRTAFALIFVLTTLYPASLFGAEENKVIRTPGGSIQTVLGFGIVLNKQSSLVREWVIVTDDSVPAEIAPPVGVRTVYKSGERYSSGEYQYSAAYNILPKEDLTAIELRFLLFNIWGEHVRTLSATEIIDMEADKFQKFDPEWRIYSENEASEYYASITYIARVRTKTGKVIEANSVAVLEQAKRFSKQFSESNLSPTPVTK